MMERNMNLTCHIADWYMGTNDSDCGRHLFDGYNTQFVKGKFARDQ